MSDDTDRRITPEKLDEITQLLSALEEFVGPALDLTPEQKEEMLGNSDRLKAALAGGFEVPQDHPDLADPDSEVSKLNDSISRVGMLGRVTKTLGEALETVENARKANDERLLRQSVEIFKAVEKAAEEGRPGAAEAYAELVRAFEQTKMAMLLNPEDEPKGCK